MATRITLNVPEAPEQAALYDRYFTDHGVTPDTMLEAMRLTFRRADVFLGDALESFEAAGTFRSACGAGCGYCCHTLVSVLPPEAFFVADALATGMTPDRRDAFVERVRRADAEHRGKNGAARYAARAACPFLDPDSWFCGLHEARPTACRAMHSGSLPACKKAYEDRDPTVPAPSMKVFFRQRDAVHAGIATALSRRGLAMAPLELNAALVTIWDGEDVFGRWLSGEDVFTEARLSRAA